MLAATNASAALRCADRHSPFWNWSITEDIINNDITQRQSAERLLEVPRKDPYWGGTRVDIGYSKPESGAVLIFRSYGAQADTGRVSKAGELSYKLMLEILDKSGHSYKASERLAYTLVLTKTPLAELPALVEKLSAKLKEYEQTQNNRVRNFTNKQNPTAEEVQSLVGARVRVISKWPNQEKITMEGVIQSAHLSKDEIKLLSIKLREDNGRTRTYEHTVKGRDSLKVEVLTDSTLYPFTLSALTRGQQVYQVGFFGNPLSMLRFLQSTEPHTTMRVLYLANEGGGKAVIKEAEVAVGKVPSEQEYAIEALRLVSAGLPDRASFTFWKGNEKLELQIVDILAIAYEPKAQ